MSQRTPGAAAAVRPRFVAPPYQDAAESGRLILRDGTTAEIRAVCAKDRDAVDAFFHRLSADSLRRRFLSASLPRPELIDRLVGATDPRNNLTLIATRLQDGVPHVIAIGSYLCRGAKAPEVAIAVADAFLGLGLGTLLLERLALIASRHGFTRFWSVMALDDAATHDVLRSSGFVVREQPEQGEIEIELDIAATAASVAGLETRDRVATIASLLPFFKPGSVAVVGASRESSSVGRRVLEGLRSAGYTGSLYPVNPKATELDGLKCYPSVRDIPGRVDLAVIAVPAQAVLAVVDDCALRGVRALTVISAGFAETGPDGAALQKALVEKVRAYGMRMVGPNCLGLLNTDPAVRLNASFSPVFPPRGRVAMSSQSGAVGLAALHAAKRFGLGFSTFVSVGNKADVSGNDLLQFWEEDPATAVILFYLESYGNPRRFSRIARRVGRSKPVVVLQSGLTRAGSRAAGSHTAALATNAAAVEALFRQTGVVHAETLEEMFDLALVFDGQPLPAGQRVGIVTNAGGPGILCADACEASGLTVPALSQELHAKLAALLPAAASLGNPIDLIASAGPDAYRLAIKTLLASNEIDALIAIFTPVGLAETPDVAKAITDGLKEARQAGSVAPMLACILGEDTDRTHIDLPGERVPCFPFPEIPARVLGKAAAYAAWRNRPPEVFLDFDNLDTAAARTICEQALAKSGPGWLSAEDVSAVLNAVGLPTVQSVVARTTEEAVTAAMRFGFPVAVKLASRQLIHKTEAGGVHLNAADAEEVRLACREIQNHVMQHHFSSAAMEGVIVQPMMTGGVEVMAGVAHDPLFGPLVAFGLGGTHVEVTADVAFRVAPLSDRDAAEMVRGIRGIRLLEGYRGHPPADLDAIQELLLRLSRLVEEIPEIGEIDFNPIFAFTPGEGCRIVDARIHVRPTP